jgi:hypothetical protein
MLAMVRDDSGRRSHWRINRFGSALLAKTTADGVQYPSSESPTSRKCPEKQKGVKQ